MDKPYIYDVSTPELATWLKENKEPAFRLKQIREWLWKGILSSEEMTNLPLSLRNKLDGAFSFDNLELLDVLESKLDDTAKYVWRLKDGNIIESVFMRYKSGTSVCVSSQVGCQMGCAFCASSMLGYARNLTLGELLAQVAIISRNRASRIDHIVVMGIGEPLQNYDTIVAFLRAANDPSVFNISLRKMTVSTCGLIPQMIKFANEGLPITLAISLHATTDALRSQIMPVNRQYPIKELMQTCREYVKISGRRITFEYAMFKGVNDSEEDAVRLAAMVRGLQAHINIIPANAVPGTDFRRSDARTIDAFVRVLAEKNVEATVRRELGADIMAACGQLRRQKTQ